MSRITWEHIRPLLTSWHLEDPDLRCQFRCPVTGRTLDAAAPALSATGEGPRPTPLRAKAMRRGFWHGMQAGMRDLLAPTSPTSGQSAPIPVPHDELDEPHRPAALQAFRGVVSQLWWDAEAGRWMSPAAGVLGGTGFLEQRRLHPVTGPGDLGLLARMVTEVSLDPADLAGATPGPARETMVMLAWANILCDESLDPAGDRRLEAHAAGLGIPFVRAAHFRHLAARHVLETSLKQLEAFLEDDRQVREEAGDIARRLGLGRTESDQALALYFDGPPGREEPCRDA